MLDNPCNILANSRLFIFCGGATYDRSFPVSKFIIDSRASHSVTSFYEGLFDNRSSGEEIITNHFNEISLAQSHFGCMMNYKKFMSQREYRLSKICERINAVVLKKDDVIPPGGVVNTLKGERKEINTKIKMVDFDFPYNHITPFPVSDENKIGVDRSFNEIFNYASSFLA
jgi:hypothetical protein